MTIALQSSASSLWARRKGSIKVLDLTLHGGKQIHRQESETISRNYDVQEVLGHGSLGVVYRGVHRSDGKQVALKFIRTSDEQKVGIAKEEFLLMKNIRHPNIVAAFDFFETSEGAVMALSFCEGATLSAALKRQSKFGEVVSHKLFVSLLQAVDHLHQNHIVHCDIKPDNIMVSHDFAEVTLIDFNIARIIPEDSEGGMLSPDCTPKFAAPEVREIAWASPATDIWGAGMCLHMMLTGRRLYVDMQVRAVRLNDSGMLTISAPCKATLSQCVAIDYSMRPTAITLLSQDVWVRDGPAAEDFVSLSDHDTHAPFLELKLSCHHSSGSSSTTACDSPDGFSDDMSADECLQEMVDEEHMTAGKGLRMLIS